MTQSPQDPSAASAEGRQARAHAEDTRTPFLLYRDRERHERIHVIAPGRRTLTIGRAASADISLSWDEKVSRLHARLELVGDDVAADWTLVDDGLSRNGSFLNGDWVRGRARLRDGDRMSFGDTAVVFRAPAEWDEPTPPAEPTEPGAADLGVQLENPTVMSPRPVTRTSLSDSQRRVLAALARPPDRPATDAEIAAELFLSTETVRAHLAKLAQAFGVGDVADDAQRARLIELARQMGLLPGR
jgi:pSer/pThr/pTyr-binding forkhead associated (FHA) protein